MFLIKDLIVIKNKHAWFGGKCTKKVGKNKQKSKKIIVIFLSLLAFLINCQYLVL